MESGELPQINILDACALVGAESGELTARTPDRAVFKVQIAGAPYALKLFPPPKGFAATRFSSDELRERALREARMFRACASSHVARPGPAGLTLATIDGHDLAFFCDGFVDGRTLEATVTADGRLPASEVARLGLQIGGAIGALWDVGKLHRDIRPATIVVHERQYVLDDAGLVFDVAGDAVGDIIPRGTPAYQAPEHFDRSTRRTVFDFRADIFSLGVTMYEAATGRHPFAAAGQSRWQLFYAITSLEPDPPARWAPELPAALEAAILRMLAKAPHDRYATCDLLLEDLERAHTAS